MTFREDFQKTEARASRGGSGSAIGIGGGIGGLLLIGLYLLLGGNPADLDQLTGNNDNQPQLEQNQSQSLDHCKTGADANKNIDCRIEFTGISVDRVWSKVLPAQAGLKYTQPGLRIFDGTTNTGCGRASSSTGPFYCPGDSTSYFDVSFFKTLERMGGGSGPLAQEYVVAHEFGHHIQQIEGTLGRSNYNEPGPESDAVKIELQADCYAGIWANHADDGEDAILNKLTESQVRDALKTTQAIGDDTIQSHSGGGIKPDQWTHGSADQRTEAFLKGYNSGQMAQCDTLNRGVYKS